MSNVGIAESSMERCLQNMPYEILYEIFRRISKFKLVEISKLCSKFRDIAGDRRFWKNVYIKYRSKAPICMTFAFEELYSEPWPVKVIDLGYAKINRPVCSQTDQEVKVTKLILPLLTNDKVTIEAILTKYQCTELYLNTRCIDSENHVSVGFEPEALLKQTSLEVLSLSGIMSNRHCHHWLTPALNYCKQLKTLDLRDTVSVHRDTLSFVENLPTSLEKLFFGITDSDFSGGLLRLTYVKKKVKFLIGQGPTIEVEHLKILVQLIVSERWTNFISLWILVFNLLAENTPNLRELGLIPPLLKCSSLHKFQFLEILHVNWSHSYDINISDFHMYLMNYSALKTIFIVYRRSFRNLQEKDLKKLRRTLEPRGIFVRLAEDANEGPSEDDIFLEVLKTV